MNQYTKEVMKHFLKPRNAGIIKNADGIGKEGNQTCGDIMEVYIKVGKKNNLEIIKEIKFKTLGCPAALASSDVLCEIAKGKTFEEAEKISNTDILKKLKGLPMVKLHCSVMGAKTLKKAIADYKNKQGRK